MNSPFSDKLAKQHKFLTISMMVDFALGFASILLSLLPGLVYLYALIPFVVVFVIFVVISTRVSKLRSAQFDWQRKVIFSNLEKLASEQISKIEDPLVRKMREDELKHLSQEK